MENYIESYLKQFESASILESTELNSVIENAQKGDKAALNKIVCSFQKFIVHVASKNKVLSFCKNSGLEADLLSAGNIGLLNAIKKFNPATGALFTYYADLWIRSSIFDFINNNHTIHYPKEVIQQMNKLKKVSNGKKITKENAGIIAQKAGLEEDRVLFLDSVNYSFYSINAVNDSSDKEYNICDVSEYCSGEASDTYVMQLEMKEKVLKALRTLKTREQEIIKLYFGFGCNHHSYSEIAELLHISRARVGQILNDVLKKLKNSSKYSYLQDLQVA